MEEDDRRYKEDYCPANSRETVEVKPEEAKRLKSRSVAVRRHKLTLGRWSCFAKRTRKLSRSPLIHKGIVCALHLDHKSHRVS